MAEQVADFFGLDRALLERVDSSTFTQPGRRPARTGFLIAKAERDLGYAPRAFKAGIALLAQQMSA
jgi:dTDP-4-dehydrorhamnose reductase